MKYALKSLFLTLLTTLFLSVGMAPTAVAQTSNKPPDIMPLSQVKEGMRGTARTVFKGTASEEFGVEILGILPGGVGPHQDLIIGKLSGANADRTFVFAGMSGSPVYVGGKLVGAVSYSFAFSKEPICGITPIEQMISIFEKVPVSVGASREPVVYSMSELAADRWVAVSGRNAFSGTIASGMAANSSMAAIAGQTFRPISTPMMFSGVSQSVLDLVSPQLIGAGILPIATAGGAAGIGPLAPISDKTLVGGDSVMVHLARGDISIAAAGTVTLRDGNKVYSFGHPYFGLGTTNLPMSESHVVTVVPNANNSFKLAVSDGMVGALTQDRATGIYGVLGETPVMLPVQVTVTNSRGAVQKYRFESAVDDFLTPLLVNIGILNSLGANERSIGDTTVKLTGEVTVAGEASVKFDRRFTGPQAAALAGASAAVPLTALLKSNFEGLNITGVNLNVSVVESTRTATLERLSIDRTTVRAGETVQLTAFFRAYDGKILIQKIPILVPEGTSAGPILISVGDGATLQEKAAAQQFVPKTTAELISTINSIKRPDKIYVVGFRTSAGTIIGSSEMPNLPPTVLATINNDRSVGGSKPSVQSVFIDQEVRSSEFIITGLQTLVVEVIR